MIKKVLVFLAIFHTFLCSLFLFSSNPAFAKNEYFDDSCNYFLGFTSWNCGVEIKDNQDSLKNGIWKIAVNILIDITVAAAYLVLGYVIYGGYQYIFSAGDPGKVATGKKTLAQAFIGLAIVMSANIIMSSIRFALLGADGSFSCDLITGENCADGADAGEMVTNVIQWVIGMAGVVSAIFVVYGGIAYISASGDPNKLQKAKSIILYALIGLAIVALAEFITAFVSGIIRDANADTETGYNNNIKEVHEISQIN